MRKFLVIACLFFSIVSVIGQDNWQNIGENGAKLKLSEKWKRTSILPDLGKDQFILGTSSFLIVMEEDKLIRSKEEMIKYSEENLDVYMLSDEIKDIVKGETKYRVLNGLHHTVITFTCKVSGIGLFYQFDVFNNNDASFILISWTINAFANQHKKNMDDVVANLSYPAESSDYRQNRLKKKSLLLRQDQVELSFQYNEYIFPEVVQSAGLAQLTTIDEEIVIDLHIKDKMNTTQFSSFVKSLSNEDGVMKQVEQKESKIGGKVCEYVKFDYVAEDYGLVVEGYQFDIGNGKSFFLTSFHDKDKESIDSYVIEILNTMKLGEVEKLEVMEVVETLDLEENDFEKLFREKSKLAHHFLDWKYFYANGIYFNINDKYLVDANEVYVNRGSTKYEMLFPLEKDQRFQQLCVVDSKVYVLTNDDECFLIGPEKKSITKNISKIFEFKNSLCVVSLKKENIIKSMPVLLRGVSNVYQYNTDGSKQKLFEIQGQVISIVSMGDSIACVGKDEISQKNIIYLYKKGAELQSFPLSMDGHVEIFANLVKNTFLLKGYVDDECIILEMKNDGRLGEKLLSPELGIVAFSDDQVYILDYYYDSKVGDGRRELRVIEFPLLLDLYKNEEFSVKLLLQAIKNVPFSGVLKEKSIKEYFVSIDTALKKNHKKGLPRKIETFESFFYDMKKFGVSHEMKNSLCVLALSYLLSNGIEIIGDVSNLEKVFSSKLSDIGSPLYFGLNVLEILNDLLYNDESYMSFSESFQSASGRKLLVGIASKELNEKISESIKYIESIAINEQDVEKIVFQYPANDYLKNIFFTKLMTVSTSSVVLRILDKLIAQKNETNQDLNLWVELRFASNKTANEEDIAIVLNVLKKAEKKRFLYGALGDLYGKLASPNLQAQLHCYQKVVEENNYDEQGVALEAKMQEIKDALYHTK